ncbi:PQQ-binding-like beta-propeller repeat protein [Haloarcula salinisoli]|uniref:PQQ-binding-like beta-propeller repeat protein n=1 Tax=Haloarcula salinisoli TaxID=2487746 RepID=A0A8J7YGL7_9EURY|nr:PQQ-binding-like beta-propeller repeat protein [Halomicroarcula salinisoli]MBX0302941.1 PQQ-binding-like beta-propeller repeat protein [Halomicroarcula salinisoli]
MRKVSRRHALSSLAAGGVSLLAGCLNGFGGVQSDDHHVSRTVDISGTWPMPDFDAANTRHVPGARGPSSGPTEAWRYCAPESTENARNGIHDAPAVRGGSIYSVEREALRARNASDGAVEWEAGRVPEGIYRAPTVMEDTVYLVDYTDPPAVPEVLAVSRADGSVKWSKRLGKQWAFSPLVHDGTVYGLSSGQDTGLLQAFSTADGTEQFRIEGEFSTVLAAVDETLVAGFETGSIVALSTSDGSERWRVQTGGDQFSTPAIANGTVYIASYDDSTSGGNVDLRALRLSDGTLRWREVLQSGTEIAGLAVGDGAVYAAMNKKLEFNNSTTIAFDVDDGSRRWQYDGLNMNSPVVTEGGIYVTETRQGFDTVEGYLTALAPEDGSVRWRHETGRNVFGPVIVDDVAVLVTKPRNYTKNFGCVRILA